MKELGKVFYKENSGLETQDFLDLFLEFTEFAISPRLFRKWAGIALVAGALERRIFAEVGDHIIWPNLFIWLVAPPATGKYVIEVVNSLWTEAKNPETKTPSFHVAPTNMTKASMIDEFTKAKRVFLTKSGPPLEYSSLLVAAEEIGVFIPKYDMEFIGVLNKIWNCPPVHSESRRHGPQTEVNIPFPQLNILAGVQPGWMATALPEEMWSTGLSRRLMMVYSSEELELDLFEKAPNLAELRKKILLRLGLLATESGQFLFSDNAKLACQLWWREKCSPVVDHPKLEYYNKTRKHHHLKLCLVSAVCRNSKNLIDQVDVERAIAWLVEIESLMPDIFRAIKGKSDEQVMDELHIFLHQTYRMSMNKPIPASYLWNFLRSRVPSDKIQRILETSERSGLIERVAGEETYIPRPRVNSVGVL